MSRLRRAAVVGAVLAIGVFTWDAGAPPLAAALDVFIWLLYAFIALVGAVAGIGVVLAWQHTRESPCWLFATLGGLCLLSLPVVWPFVRETRETQRFLWNSSGELGRWAENAFR